MPPVRVDAVIGYLVDMRGVADYLLIPLPAYIENAPVFSSREAFVCHDNEVNRKFLLRANATIRQWLNTIN